MLKAFKCDSVGSIITYDDTASCEAFLSQRILHRYIVAVRINPYMIREGGNKAEGLPKYSLMSPIGSNPVDYTILRVIHP